MMTTPTITRIQGLKGKLPPAQIAREVGVSRQYVHKVNGKSPSPAPLLAVYRFIEAYRREHKVAPSLTEIAEAFPAKSGDRRSVSVVNYWLTRMTKLKMVEPRRFGVARELNLLPLNRRNPRIAAMLEAEKGDSHG